MFKQPKNAEDAALRFHHLRKHRLDLERQARETEVEELLLKQWLCAHGELDVPVLTQHCVVTVEEKPHYTMSDRDKVFDYIVNTHAKHPTWGARNLIIARLNPKTVREYQDAKRRIAGVHTDVVRDLSYRSL